MAVVVAVAVVVVAAIVDVYVFVHVVMIVIVVIVIILCFCAHFLFAVVALLLFPLQSVVIWLKADWVDAASACFRSPLLLAAGGASAAWPALRFAAPWLVHRAGVGAAGRLYLEVFVSIAMCLKRSCLPGSRLHVHVSA